MSLELETGFGPFPVPARHVPTPGLYAAWSSLGPDTIAGRICCLAPHPTDPLLLYAGAANGGVWRTDNGGALWRPLMNEQPWLAIGALALCKGSPDHLFAATGEDADAPSVFSGNGVWLSTDGGETWDLVPSGSLKCTAIAVHPTDPTVWYVAGTGGVWRSGTEQVLSGHVTDLVMDPTDPELLYAAVFGIGLYRSGDGGKTWGPVLAPMTFGYSHIAMGLSGAYGTSFLLVLVANGLGADLYQTTDGGTSWTLAATFADEAPGFDWASAIAISPWDERVSLITAPYSVYRSVPGGGYAKVGAPNLADHHALAFSCNDPNVIYMASDGGGAKTVDSGDTWGSILNQGLATVQFYGMAVSANGPFVIGGGTQDHSVLLFTEADGWHGTPTAEGGWLAIDPNWSGNIYARPWAAGPIRSNDFGATWHSMDLHGAYLRDLAVMPERALRRPPPVDGSGSPIGFPPTPRRPILLACSSDGRIFRSSDQGASWSVVFDGTNDIWTVTFSPVNPSLCWAGTADGRIVYSREAGILGTWNLSPSRLGAGGLISTIAASRTDADTLYAGLGSEPGGLYKSVDAAITWVAAAHPPGSALPPNGLPLAPISLRGTVLDSEDNVYVNTTLGVFVSRNSGATWENFSDGLPIGADVSALGMGGDDILYASTVGRGIYSRFTKPLKPI